MHRTNYEHGTLVLGTMAAYLPRVVVGSAYDADFLLFNAEDGEEEQAPARRQVRAQRAEEGADHALSRMPLCRRCVSSASAATSRLCVT